MQMNDSNIMVKILNNYFKTSSFKKSPFSFRDEQYDYFADDLKMALTILPQVNKLEKILPEIKKSIEKLIDNPQIKKLVILLPIEYEEITQAYVEFLKQKLNPPFDIQILYSNDYKNIYQQYRNFLVLEQINIKRLPKKITDIPISKTYHIQGINGLLKVIDQSLETEATKTVILYNILPGSGKTTTALSFVNKYQKKFNHIAYIRLHGDIKIAFYNTFWQGKLKFKYNKELSETENFYNLLKILNKIPGENLLILDGITNINSVAKLLILKNKLTWKKIIISDFYIFGYTNIKIPQLSIQNCEKIIRFYTKEKKIKLSTEKINTLIKKLDNHPLLIHFYAKNLVYNDGIDIDKLIELIEKKDKSSQYFSEYLQKSVNTEINKQINNFLKYISAIFELRQKWFSPMQKKILTFFASAPLKYYSTQTLKQILKIKPKDEDDFANNLLDLISQGWLDSDKNGIYTYSLIAVVLHKKLKPSTKKLNHYLEYLDEKLQNPNINEALIYLPDAEVVISTLFDVNILTARLLEQAANIYKILQRPEASAYYKLSADILVHIYGENMEAIMSEYVALLYKKAGDYHNSIFFANNALEKIKHQEQTPSEDSAHIHLLLAELLYQVGHFHQAYVHAEQAYDIMINIYDENNIKIKKIQELMEKIFNKL